MGGFVDGGRAMTVLEVRDVAAGYDGRTVLAGVSFEVQSGERWAVLGRNGTGKSTLVKAIAALLAPRSGSVNVCGTPVRAYSARDRATRIAYVPQKPEATIPYTVYDFVMLGRFPSMGLFGMPTESDHAVVRQSLDFCDVASLADRMMGTLSGGEMQRVLLAGALAQQTPILLLDEPTTHLDPAHERLFFRALHSARQNRDITIVMVTHDINTALTSCTHVLALLQGRVHYSGTVEGFRGQCPAILGTLFGIEFSCYANPANAAEVFGTWGQTA
jgi:iron complex transport system ATP-binding protein